MGAEDAFSLVRTAAFGQPWDLAISKTHSGNFTPGDTGKQFTITVSLAGGAANCLIGGSDLTVTDTLPAGLTATSFGGSEWTNCTATPVTGPATLTCQVLGLVVFSPNPLPAITLTVDVANNAPASVTNTATISASGGCGDNAPNLANNTANDPTTILAVTPFATFTAQQLDIKLRPRINDAFEFQSRFTLGAGSNGIAPLTEQVELALTGGTGAFTTTIPAGAFTQHKQGQFRFKGTIDGVKLDAKITPLGGAVYKFVIEGDQADLTGLANPVTVTLTIGNDSGSTIVKAHSEPRH